MCCRMWHCDTMHVLHMTRSLEHVVQGRNSASARRPASVQKYPPYIVNLWSTSSSYRTDLLAVSVHLIHWRAAFVRSVPGPVRPIIIHWPGASLGLAFMALNPLHSSKPRTAAGGPGVRSSLTAPQAPSGTVTGDGCRLTLSEAVICGQRRADACNRRLEWKYSFYCDPDSGQRSINVFSNHACCIPVALTAAWTCIHIQLHYFTHLPAALHPVYLWQINQSVNQ